MAEIERLADGFLRSPHAIVLAEGERSQSLRRRDGTLIPAADAERTYSTPQLLALEQGILKYAIERRAAGVGPATSRAVERAIERRPSLAGEQVEMVRRLTQDGDGVAVVVGQAGAGKTFALAAAHEAWEASGRRVYGTALARSAARELRGKRRHPEHERDGAAAGPGTPPALDDRAALVLVIDEAAMVPTRELARVVDHARRLDVKLVLVGDHRQLQAIGAGGVFRGLLTRLPAIELTENRRQELQWERDALRLARDGAAREAVPRYDHAGRIEVGKDAAELRGHLVADWWAQRDPGGSLMIAQRRVDVADLNGRAHALMRSAGALGAEEMRVAGTPFSVGDQVVLRRNDHALGVVNGDRGVVSRLIPAEGRIELELAGRKVALTREYLEQPTRHGTPALTHGYAITGHLAQGMTCRCTFILATDELTREAAYVALSRGRESNRIYALEPAAPERAEYAPAARRGKDARTALVDALGRSRAQTMASDVARPVPLVTELAEVRRQRDELGDARRDARVELRRLEREQPAWYRPRARTEHAAAIDGAKKIIQRIDPALRDLDSRERKLHEQLARERAAREPERVRERPVRTRELGRDIGLGR